MKFDLSNELDVKKFLTKIDKDIEKGKRVEYKVQSKPRNLSQNAYLHVAITLYAIEFGSTLNEAKTDLKRMYPKGVYIKDGKQYLVETSKMNQEEISDFINWIREHAGKEGCYIPTSEEYLEQKFYIDREIDKQKQYL
jgi:hypothetical protein